MNDRVTTNGLDAWLESRTGRWCEILLIAILLPNPAMFGMTGGISLGLNPYSFLGLLPLMAWWGYRVWGLGRQGRVRAFLKRMLGVLVLLLVANALLYLLQKLVVWLFGATGAGTSIAGNFSGIGGGIAFGMLWMAAFYILSYPLVFGLLWLAWRWLERKRLPFSESLRLNLLATAGWATLAMLIGTVVFAVSLLIPPER